MAACRPSGPTVTNSPLSALLPAGQQFLRIFAVIGPGLVVMLADTDAGSVITAAQSGAQYGYRLLVWEIALIPALYVVQEITVRLGLATGSGHGELIRASFGRRWAVLSAATLSVACVGALVTEFTGLAGVAALVGLPRYVPVGTGAAGIAVLIMTGRCRRVVRIGLALGAMELLFIPAAVLAHPHGPALMQGLGDPLQASTPYLTMLAANVGAVIMPWMVFYQQQAVSDMGHRGFTRREALRLARLDTAAGSVVTQLVMIAILVAAAATVGVIRPGASLTSVADIASGLTPVLGRAGTLILFGLGVIGAASVAAVVVALAGAWGAAEALGWRHSLNDPLSRAPRFYGLAAAGLAVGAVLALLSPDPAGLSVGVEVLNACLLPIVLGFLLALERRALPSAMRMRGTRLAVTYVLTGAIIAFGVYTAMRIVAGAV